jgi:hypothetical protein
MEIQKFQKLVLILVNPSLIIKLLTNLLVNTSNYNASSLNRSTHD